jgi:hypothetical protein
MDEPPHVEGCPGCQAANLTEEDRVYLRSTGWQDPRHVLAPRPQMAPPPPEANPAGVVFAWLTGLVIWWIFMANHPIITLILTVLVVGLLIFLRRNHKLNHRKDGRPKPGCSMCQREDRKQATKEWFEYRRLAAADQARSQQETHAAHYQQLLAQERRRQQDGQ